MSSHRWKKFFIESGLPGEVADNYAVIFTENRIRFDMLDEINKEILYDMNIRKLGDVIAILRHAKEVHINSHKERLFAHDSDEKNVSKAADSTISNDDSLKSTFSPTSQFRRIVVGKTNITNRGNNSKLPPVRQVTGLDQNTIKVTRKRILAPGEEPPAQDKHFKPLSSDPVVRNRIDNQNRLSRFSKEIQSAIRSNSPSETEAVTTSVKARLALPNTSTSQPSGRKLTINRNFGDKKSFQNRIGGSSIKGKFQDCFSPKSDILKLL